MTEDLWFWFSAWLVAMLTIFITIPVAILAGKFWHWLEKKL